MLPIALMMQCDYGGFGDDDDDDDDDTDVL
jgi:hypothetical protein